MSDYTSILVDVTDGIGTVTMNRPERLNALNREMGREIQQAFAAFATDEAVRVIVLKGAGRAFCAGADLNPGAAVANLSHSVPDDERGIASGIENWLSVWNHPKPVIAQVHGYCIGGGAHAASFCDLIMIAEDTVVGWPKIPVGGGFISPVWSWFVGPRRAKELSFTVGNTLSGTEAAQMGWANRAVPADQLEAETRAVAERIATVPPDLLRVKKMAINRAMDVRGFTTGVRATSAWDAIAHASPNVEILRGKLRELGIKGAIEWFEAGGLK